MRENELVPSIEDKLWTAIQLSWECVDHNPNLCGDYLWGYVEGLYQKRILDRVNGRCSIADMLSFDLEQEEKEIDYDIRIMQRYIHLFIN